jgi:hypothetical protein
MKSIHLAGCILGETLFQSEPGPDEFQVGESVFLKLQPYVQQSLVQHKFPKLSYKFYGPYKILELPPSSKIHDVFHVSRLKPFRPDFTATSNELLVQIQLDAQDVETEVILDRRLSAKGKTEVIHQRLDESLVLTI